uniref:Uncharacterized protein n=1 Tax=Anopheles atroparvus TaxID=41427 RepID=A0A182JIV9_ANOAO
MSKVKFIILLGLVVLATGKPHGSNRRSSTSGAPRQWTYELHRFHDSDRVSEAEFFNRFFEDLREDRYAGEYPPFVSLPDYEAGEEEDRLLDEFDLQDPALHGEQSGESRDPDGIGANTAGNPKQDGLENEQGANNQGSANEVKPSDQVERKEDKATPKKHPSGGEEPQAEREDPIQHHEEKDSERSPLSGNDKHHGKPAGSRGNKRQHDEKSVPKDSQPKKEGEQEVLSQDKRSEPQQPPAVGSPQEHPSGSHPAQFEVQGNPEALLVQINVNVASPA